MDALTNAANSQGVQGLINTFYDMAEVHGFALGVHGKFVSLFRGQFGRTFGINDILSDGRVPQGWAEACTSQGYVEALSPIYVVIYVTVNAKAFRISRNVPRTIPPNYAVFVQKKAPFEATSDRARHRPIRGGTSAASHSRSNHSGTIGGFLENPDTGEIYLHSCNHVLLNALDDVVQQSSGDGGAAPGDKVAVTSYVVPLAPPAGFSFSAPYNDVDSALAKVDHTVGVSSTVRMLGPVTSMAETSKLGLGDKVVFVGKESDSQDAYIHHRIARAKIKIDGTIYNFGDLFEIRPRRKLYFGSLCKPGDSGSWVVRETDHRANELCGQLIADNKKKSALCCFIETVIAALEKEAKQTFRLY
jgi:hypothetical protein